MKQDNWDVPSFANNGKVTGTLKNISPKVYKEKKNYKIIKKVVGPILVIVGLTTVVGLQTARVGEQAVAHKGDTVGYHGEISHYHQLTKEDFMRDFLYLNPGASDEDIINALQNGEYEYYLENDGKIKLHPGMTVFQFKPYSDDRYNNEVVEHIDDIMEEYNMEESHGKTR